MKKTMRKSALLSSVAMLIVSAIVLTSATYAWFSASDEAKITNISTTVQTSTGLLISTDNVSWGSEVNATPFQPTQFKASSTVSGSKFVSGNFDKGALQLDDVTVAGNSNAASNYMQFTLYIKGSANDVVTIKPNFEGTHDTVKGFMKFAVLQGTTYLGGGVVAATGATGSYKGTEATGAVTSATSGAYLTENGSTVNEIGASVQTTLTSTASQQYTILMWAEGNDADCNAETITGTDVKAVIDITRPTPAA